MVTRRKGEMVKMESAGERVNLEFNMPSRGIIGLRTNVLTASAGEAIMAHRFKEYQPYKGEIDAVPTVHHCHGVGYSLCLCHR